MGLLTKIWAIWDTTTGRILAIIGGLSVIAGAIIVIIGFISDIFDLDKPDCFDKNLSFSEFEDCVFDEREIYKKDFFVDEWTKKRIIAVARLSVVIPHDDSEFGDSPKSKNRVWVYLSAWGPDKGYGQSLIECRSNFKTGKEALDYWNSLKRFNKDDKVRFTGKIVEVTRKTLPVDECLILEKASD